MKLIDHTDPKFVSLSRAFGGAYTYSADLVKFQVPKWQEVLGAKDVVSTCPTPGQATIDGRFDTAIWYLHKYPFGDPILYVRNALAKCTAKFKRIIFVTAYKAYRDRLLDAGYKAVYIPMSIDVADIRRFAGRKTRADRVLYFGNVYSVKRSVFTEIQKYCEENRIVLDVLSYRKLNGVTPVDTRQATCKMVSQYKYGIGVGRCALEMWALGLKVIVAGRQWGGLVTNDAEYETQMSTNANGRLNTYSRDLDKCFTDIDLSIIRTTDIASMDHVEEVKRFYTI